MMGQRGRESPKALNWDLSEETYASILACESPFPLEELYKGQDHDMGHILYTSI